MKHLKTAIIFTAAFTMLSLAGCGLGFDTEAPVAGSASRVLSGYVMKTQDSALYPSQTKMVTVTCDEGKKVLASGTKRRVQPWMGHPGPQEHHDSLFYPVY